MWRERPIGEVFKVDGVDCVVVPDAKGTVGCMFCAFCDTCVVRNSLTPEAGYCIAGFRKDGVNVHFERFNDGHHLTRHLDGGKKSPVATDREQ